VRSGSPSSQPHRQEHSGTCRNSYAHASALGDIRASAFVRQLQVESAVAFPAFAPGVRPALRILWRATRAAGQRDPGDGSARTASPLSRECALRKLTDVCSDTGSGPTLGEPALREHINKAVFERMQFSNTRAAESRLSDPDGRVLRVPGAMFQRSRSYTSSLHTRSLSAPFFRSQLPRFWSRRPASHRANLEIVHPISGHAVSLDSPWFPAYLWATAAAQFAPPPRA
jgi:hypothetical protein